MTLTAIATHDDGGEAWLAILAVAQGKRPTPALMATPEWRAFAPLALAVRERRPFVIGQIGQSLDGRSATVTGHSQYINGQAALRHLHRLRALVDGVVIGVGTALADDPQLTVRHAAGPQPVRVVIDPSGRLPSAARCLASDQARCLVVRGEGAPDTAGAESLRVPSPDGIMAPSAVLAALAGAGLRRVLIEGGPKTLSRFLAAGCLNRLHMLVGPLVIGSGRSALQLPDIAHLDAALRPTVTPYAFAGGDLLLDCDFRS